MIKDAAGNLVNSAGKIVMSAADVAAKLPGQIGNLLGQFGNNIMNDPSNTSADYLASMGYHEMDTGEMVPGGVTGPTVGAYDVGAYGAGGGGGSYFHGGASAGANLSTPSGYHYPTHGATSVAGAFYTGGSGPVNLSLEARV
jgi:hypothetical protein